ncbi:MAG: tetratricopeptide repeat protein [Spirochaetes bacterium]|nr:tetratricopeptide repeat protein [Spirochaetota bacterium]
MNQYKQHKMSKSELKVNWLLEHVINLRHYIVHNKKKIKNLLLVFAAVILILIIYIANLSSRNLSADALLGEAGKILLSKNVTQKISEADSKLKEVIRGYSGTYAAAKANFYLGNINYTFNKKFKNAVENYKKAADYGSGTYLFSVSLLAMGNAYLQMKKFNDAVKTYDRIISKSSQSGFHNTALWKKAHALLGANRYSEANSIFDKIAKSNSAWSKQAMKFKLYNEVESRRKK